MLFKRIMTQLITLVFLSLVCLAGYSYGESPIVNRTWKPFDNPHLEIPWDIQMFDQNTGFIVGYCGSAYQSQDGGYTWNPYLPIWSGDSQSWYHRFYKYSSTHWLIGGLGVIHSTHDAGQTWHTYQSPQDPFDADHIDIYDLNLLNDTTGYACGGHAMIMKTNDGGITWQKQRQGRGIFTGIACKDLLSPLSVGYCASTANSVIIHLYGQHVITIILAHDTSYGLWGNETSNNWSVSSALADRWGDVYFINSTTGWVTSTEDKTGVRHILKTMDGGKSWNRFSLDSSSGSIIEVEAKIQFLDENNGYVLIQNEDKLYKTIDGGLTWSKLVLPSNISLTRMCFSSITEGWLSGYDDAYCGVILKTADGGLTWRVLFQSGFANNCKGESISFSPDGAGYMGGGGIIYQTLDNGSSWYCNSRITNNLRQIYALSGDTVYILGNDDYRPLFSTDSGLTWSGLTCCLMNQLGEMQFYGRDTGWLCGNSSSYMLGTSDYLYKTIDGGHNWSLVYKNNTAIFMSALSFVNSLRGWTIGSDTTILTTEDGGYNWRPQYVPTGYSNNPDYRDIYFMNDKRGWLVDGHGGIFTTTDGGDTWSLWGNPISSAWKKICFKNSLTGWIIGEEGNLLYTVDGGNQWTLSTQVINPLVSEIVFSPDGTGWITSRNTAIPLYKLAEDALIENTSINNNQWEIFE